MNQIELNEIAKKINEANKSYYNTGYTTMSDQEYDALKELLKFHSPNHPIFEQVGEKVSSNWEKAEHEIFMGSLEKVHTEDEFLKWAEKFKDEEFIIQPKYDGLSLETKYDNGSFVQAITRGDGYIGEDISNNVKKMSGFKEEFESILVNQDQLTFTARCEVILCKSELNNINSIIEEDKVYKNCRNAASGISRRLDGRYCKYLKLFYYDILTPEPMNEDEKIELLKKLLLESVPYSVGNIKKMVDSYNKFKAGRDRLPYGIDGMVIKINSWKKQQELGVVNNRPKGQIAWKFDPPGAATILTRVTPEVGRTGVITPLGHVDPVEIDGSIISKVTLHNYDEIKRLEVGLGDLVMLVKKGDIIPKIISVIDHKNIPIDIPDKCPVCNGNVVNDGVKLFCVNESCIAKHFQRILNFIKTLKIDGFGDALAEKLFDLGKLKYLADVFDLKNEDIAEIDGWGEKSAQTIISNINNLKQSIDPIIFLASMGIPTLSISTAEDLWGKYGSIDKILEATVDDICTMKGYSQISATKIVSGLSEWAPQILRVLSYVKLKDKTQGKLSGMSFCFTGEMSNPRPFFQNIVSKHGGKNDSSVTKNTTYLVCNENKGSSKYKKAEQYNTKIINENQFMKMVGESLPKKLITQPMFEGE